jgi:2-oxoglutarate ferredoxin oxidoreductase subunit alpha
MLERDDVRARFVQVVYVEPFPVKAVGEALKDAGVSVLLETNQTGQLGKLVRLNNGFDFDHVYLRYDGRPFNPGEIRDRVAGVLR